MRKIILIGGDLASGKSTYSYFLRDKFKLGLINKDHLKEILGDHIIAVNRAENKNLSVISFALIKYIIASTKENLIIESNFKKEEMQELAKLTEEISFLSLKFMGDYEMLHQRFLDRLANRHPVHKSQDFSDIKDFIPVIDELRNVNYIGKVINVNVSDAQTCENQALLQQIESFLKE